jgi:phage tail sheath protein FI
MNDYKTPGVYIEEIPKLPPSIASVETAIPAFIGYTEKAQLKKADDLINAPHEISSMLEYVMYFGDAFPETGIQINIDRSDPNRININGEIDPAVRSKYLMYYSLQMFFANGGGRCFIVSVGKYPAEIELKPLQDGLAKVEGIDDVTLLLFPDGMGLAAGEYYTLQNLSLNQCFRLQDRFAVMDVWMPAIPDVAFDPIATLRNAISSEILEKKYGAVYYPRIYTQLDYKYDTTKEELIKVTGAAFDNLKAIFPEDNALYNQIKAAINRIDVLLPASSAVVGKYAEVDSSRGVWKAPANVNLTYVSKPEIIITQKQQEPLNVDVKDGKSINVIRSFPGRGPAIIWGARTLAGNDNEWRYVSVRRFFNMVEESVKNATNQFVFEPNDRNTWVRVKSMIENYLTQQWKAGALMGASTKEAFFIHVGLGETMTELDIWEGRMIIEIGMAVVRPAEFIILKFMHKMLSES